MLTIIRVQSHTPTHLVEHFCLDTLSVTAVCLSYIKDRVATEQSTLSVVVAGLLLFIIEALLIQRKYLLEPNCC